MMKQYEHRTIESRWQERWETEQVFKTPELADGEKGTFILDMFPYPSGAGLHVGHLLGYTGSDILARIARMQGKKVLHPMGWDAFGLPAENYAIKTNVHPSISTIKNTLEYKRQFRQVGISYDWNREINTSSPEYYQWTQWLFAFLYERGLAYQKDGLVNWCPNDQTVLANEQVVGGKCDRCGAEVVQRQLKQWYFKITDYAERLITDLDELDWPEKIKTMQRNWIGRSEGAAIWFDVVGSSEKIEVFSTRPDTIYGASYLVVAPEHALLSTLVTPQQKDAVAAYIEQTSKKSELERSFTDKVKTGVWTGAFALNPATGEQVPVWVADYVLSTYGTGAVMGVPAHDTRDFEFATVYSLPIIQVIGVQGQELPLTGHGPLINSGTFTGRDSADAIKEIAEAIKGEWRITYRLRDWLVSRQRFWGSPIPIAYDEAGVQHLIPQSEYPIELPMNISFQATGQSPLVSAEDWKQYRPEGEKGPVWTRETDTLDGFVCSSWYFLRFANPHSATAAFDSKAVEGWLPVDTYVGGAEHAVLHLLYARFFTKVLYDAGMVTFKEPFTALRNQGMILGPDHNKMSKSKGNVINPDDVVTEYGADTLRLYEMFMGPFDQEKPWSTTGIIGVRRFLEKFWKLQEKVADTMPADEENRIVHSAVKKVSEAIPVCRFNTAISSLMEAVNALSAAEYVSKEGYAVLIRVLSPLAPHITEELWVDYGTGGFCSLAAWPEYNSEFTIEDVVTYPVQINGKVRFNISLPRTLTEPEIRAAVEAEPDLQKYLGGSVIQKVIVVPGKIISYVVAS